MCAELAAGELKWLFLKIHYFGRKINWKRRAAKKGECDEVGPLGEAEEVEVKELLNIINQIRAKYPEKREITPVDLLKVGSESGEELSNFAMGELLEILICLEFCTQFATNFFKMF